MTIKSFISAIAVLSFFIPGELSAGQDNNEHHHHGHLYELGLSAGYSHLQEENENAAGAHLHFLRRLGEDNGLEKFSLGLGVEYLFTEHTHLSLLGTISYNPFADFIIDFAPGVLISEHENKSELHYITHIEFTYEFDLHGFGFGPVLGFAFSEDDRHYMIGIHFGKGL